MKQYDYVIKDATLIDGTGSPSYISDLAISGNKIDSIDRSINISCKKVIQAKGLILCPGFIDIHGHTDHFLCVDPQGESKISQGVTTEVFGNCGYSPFLLTGKFKKHFQDEFNFYHLKNPWHDLESFTKRVEEFRPALNWMTLIGHGTLRLACMGHEDRAPSAHEFKWMKNVLEKALDQGACGLSSGLIYTPGCFAKTREIIELMKVVSKKGGFYATHMRSEGDKLIPSIQEAIKISSASKAPLQISHLKTAGEQNWNKIDLVLELLEKKISEGEDITWDRYPYTASFTSLDTCLPRHLFDGGDLKAVERVKNARVRSKYIQFLESQNSRFHLTLIANVPGQANKKWIGLSLEQCSKLSGKSIGEFALDLLIEEKMQVNAIFFSMSEKNLDRIILHSRAMIGSDASARSSKGKTFLAHVHPRTYGTFPRFLKVYAIDSKRIPIESAIHKMTGLTAQRLGLKKRGTLKAGHYADLVLFDPKKLSDQATFQQPTRLCRGLERVFVNGCPIFENGQLTTKRSGLFIARGD